jgi:hydroxymethylbilane synthase
LDRVGGGCNLPLGVFARVLDGEIMIDAVLASADGSVIVRERAKGDGGAEELAGKLLASSVGGSFRGF